MSVLGVFQKISKYIVKQHEKVFFLVLLVVLVSTRLVNLGYSDYIQDESGTFFYKGGTKNVHLTKYEYLLNEAKGPLQNIVAYMPYLIVGNYDNHLAQRLPFAIFSIAAIFAFYFFVKKVTSDPLVSFIAAFILGTNGLIVAYGRIAQYQNLLLFFSFSALYFYSSLLLSSPKVKRDTLLGTVLLCFAFYSHWYAVFACIPALMFFFVYLNSARPTFKEILKLLALNVFIAAIIILPFFVPYFRTALNSEKNTSYASSILGGGGPFIERADFEQFVLYNPFLTIYVYIFVGFLGTLTKKRSVIFSLWFIAVLLFFRYLVSYTGLHFYNIFIPVTVLVSFGFVRLIRSKRTLVSRFGSLVTASTLFFTFYQSYMLFVDHNVEYPYEQERILSFKTREYSQNDNIRHKTGFPHNREWLEIREFLDDQNATLESPLGYYTNEDKGIARIYLNHLNVTTERPFYAIGIKRPYSFANDYKFPQFSNKSTIKKITNDAGNTVVRIYLVKEF